MKEIHSETDLKEAILLLDSKQADEGRMLKEQFYFTLDSMKPVNLIKSTFKEVVGSTDLKDNILNTSVGLTAGFLSKLLIQGVMKSPVNRLIGTALMFGITNVVTKNPETFKSIGKGFFKMIRGKSENRNNPADHTEPNQIG